ncbi:hypothetical protein K458DRAFT_385519 [Lentithecium fluviatile CBS 122367]|uniref:Inheritance of peroxisomes protein 1 n=1 Tax=Lentithecium fluviatile CBS 122367 TaxID=1168545 RepID=A0A6G1JCR7_9PLEO|nr:hypothetical protein K458DRAFT_385519 [Lentithecium fluviatile CBS 122367]
MSSPDDSKTPERAPPAAAAAAASNPVRRSFTLPARIANKPRPAPAPAASADGIETLFVCTSTKIVSFTASGPNRRASPSRRPRANDDEATSQPIPWRSAAERTLAVGVLRIYRVTSSNVSFLNSGNLLHTIFPKSQCWCVDGESIFVLRIRQDSYYRIELPHESTEDREKVEQFKTVLDQVLQYEKTRSPFSQTSAVELPERPKTPPRRRSIKPPEKAKKWTFDKKWMPEDTSRPATPVAQGSDSGTTSSYEEDDRSSINTDKSEAAPESPTTNLEVTPLKLPPQPRPVSSVLERARSFQGTRSVTAPTAVSVRRPSIAETSISEEAEEGMASEVSREDTNAGAEAESSVERKDSVDTQSLMSSTDSFYSLDTHRSPSPHFEDAEAELINPWADIPAMQEQDARGRSKHRRQTSELTLRAPSSEPADKDAPTTPTTDQPVSSPTVHINLSSPPSTPPLVSDSDDDSVRPPSLDVPTPPVALRMKRLTGASQKRAFSPMPQPQNLFCPPAHNQRKQFTTALIRKTCEIVLGPPAHLVQLMLRIAANISDGVFGFKTYRVPRTTEKIPCSWESSDEDEWPEEDDFGIPLRTLDDSTVRRRNFSSDLD